MTIHIFNPEHDIALATNLENFTAPHAGRELRHDLGFLPALWAKENEFTLVDDIDEAKEGLRRLGIKISARLIDADTLSPIMKCIKDDIIIKPWGWDIAIRNSVKKIGIAVSDLPKPATLNKMRMISHRRWAAENLLPELTTITDTVGEAKPMECIDDARRYLTQKHKIVLKAPWSSSGRGIRYVSETTDGSSNDGITPQLCGWVNNIVRKQGCVMAEPYYNKVMDFGMEFYSDGKGNSQYEGLSIFKTINGAYTGNILDDEDHKEAVLTRFVPQSLLHQIRQKISEVMGPALKHVYTGYFGVDMMLVHSTDGLAIHPCVELNLRMTMGQAANLITNRLGLEEHVMRIVYANGRYTLRIEENQNLKSN